MQGGGHREDLKPLNPEGQLHEGVRGNHRGNASALNVYNPQPGFVYYWCLHPNAEANRSGSKLQYFQNWGWEVVPPDAPEYTSREKSLNYDQLGLDGYQAHGDLVLLRITEEKHREFRAFKAQMAQVAYEGATPEYLEQSSLLEDRYGAQADGPIHYRASGHGTRSE